MRDNQFQMVAYHGTLREFAENIREKGFTPKIRKNHWLGQGVYFYDEFELAHWFIAINSKTDPQKKLGSGEIGIIKVNLGCSTEKILDLDTVQGINFFYQSIKDLWTELGTLTFLPDEHVIRCALLDIICEVYGFHVVLKTFEKPNPTYGNVDTARFDQEIFPVNIKYKERQVCVRNTECINIIEITYPKEKYVFPQKINYS